jgi:hypothetical protein
MPMAAFMTEDATKSSRLLRHDGGKILLIGGPCGNARSPWPLRAARAGRAGGRNRG